MVNNVHLMTYLLIFVGTIDEPFIGIFEHLVHISQTVHFFLHLHQQFFLCVSELLRFTLNIFKSLSQFLSVLEMLLHNGEELFEWNFN